jgi:hypothetical protein
VLYILEFKNKEAVNTKIIQGKRDSKYKMKQFDLPCDNFHCILGIVQDDSHLNTQLVTIILVLLFYDI